MKTDAAWLKSLMNGSTSQDTEAMQLLQAIMPQKIIAKIQVTGIMGLGPAWQAAGSWSGPADICRILL